MVKGMSTSDQGCGWRSPMLNAQGGLGQMARCFAKRARIVEAQQAESIQLLTLLQAMRGSADHRLCASWRRWIASNSLLV